MPVSGAPQIYCLFQRQVRIGWFVLHAAAYVQQSSEILGVKVVKLQNRLAGSELPVPLSAYQGQKKLV